jgi:hypothetical protein
MAETMSAVRSVGADDLFGLKKSSNDGEPFTMAGMVVAFFGDPFQTREAMSDKRLTG